MRKTLSIFGLASVLTIALLAGFALYAAESHQSSGADRGSGMMGGDMMGNGAMAFIGKPAMMRAQTNEIAVRRTAKPKHSFMQQLTMPEGEAHQLQAMCDEVSMFGGWVGLVKTTYAPVESKASALVGSLTATTLSEY